MDFFGGSAPEDKPVPGRYRQKEKAWVLGDFTEWLNEVSLGKPRTLLLWAS